MMLRVRKRPGMEKEDVLKAENEQDDEGGDGEGDGDDEGGMWGMLFGSDNKKKNKGKMKDKPVAPVKAEAAVEGSASAGGVGDVINVFTIASGHMYERLQKIMFLSVVNNTKR
jgi:UDP-glucose:glycoprotein glucosyltransferase